MLTRKDYKQLAEILKLVKEEHQKIASQQNVEFLLDSIFHDLEDNLVAWLEEDNPNFDRKRFQEACQK